LNPGNFDPVVEATDPQHLLLLAEGIRNGDHLHLAWEKHGGKARCRRVATRYEKLAANYLAFVQLAQ